MRQQNLLRTTLVLTALLLVTGTVFAQLLAPAVRGKAMDAIRAKYYALAALPTGQRRVQTASFAKTLPQILSAEVTEDGNISCIFKDYVSYMILGNLVTPEPKKDKELMQNPFDLSSNFLSPLLDESNGVTEAPKANGITRTVPLIDLIRKPIAIQSTASFEPNDLPESLGARVSNSLGPSFGDCCEDIRTMLNAKGYAVAPGADCSITTLMGVRGIGVFYLQTHGGMGKVWNRDDKKFETQYILSTGEEWTEAKENDMNEIAVPGPGGGGLMKAGYLGTCEAVYDVDANGKEVSKRWFTITKKFIKTFWKFSKNSFVFVYACTSTNLGDVMADPAVNASVYCGMSDLSTSASHKWIRLLYDRLTGTNNDRFPPSEDVVAQRPFDWVKLFSDFQDRKRLWPASFVHEGVTHSPSPIFRANRDNFGILSPSIKFLRPLAYEPKLELEGVFGADPGDALRKVQIAGVGQVVEKWTPSKITIILADHALGTSGEVVVFNRNRPSNSRWLSKWTGHIGLTIAGEQSLAFNADFNVNLIGDPWNYRENPGVKPIEQMIWSTYTTSGSTCTWNASGEEKDSDNKVIRSWLGQGQPSCWLDMTQRRKNTFGVGGVADTYLKKINLYLAILSTFTLTERGTPNANTPIKLGDWMQGQTLFQAAYDSDYNIRGSQLEIDDEPSRLSYGGKSAVLVWDSMQCRYGMPRIAPR